MKCAECALEHEGAIELIPVGMAAESCSGCGAIAPNHYNNCSEDCVVALKAALAQANDERLALEHDKTDLTNHLEITKAKLAQAEAQARYAEKIVQEHISCRNEACIPLLERLDKLEAVCERVKTINQRPYCSDCGNTRMQGHADHCRLGQALAALDAKATGDRRDER